MGFSPLQYATITFQGRQVGESLRYTRSTGSCFCYAKPLGRYASPRLWLLSSKKVTPAQRKKICACSRAKILRLVSLAQNDRTITCVVFQRADVSIRSYAVFRMFRDVEDAVPYVIYINNCSPNSNFTNALNSRRILHAIVKNPPYEIS